MQHISWVHGSPSTLFSCRKGLWEAIGSSLRARSDFRTSATALICAIRMESPSHVGEAVWRQSCNKSELWRLFEVFQGFRGNLNKAVFLYLSRYAECGCFLSPFRSLYWIDGLLDSATQCFRRLSQHGGYLSLRFRLQLVFGIHLGSHLHDVFFDATAKCGSNRSKDSSMQSHLVANSTLRHGGREYRGWQTAVESKAVSR